MRRAAILIAILGGAGAAGWLIVARRASPAAPIGPAPPATPIAAGVLVSPPTTVVDAGATFEVASATGEVEAQREGRWVPIERGARLTRADVVRTAAGSSAVLRLGVGTEIELRAGVEIGLDRLTGGPSVDLRRGKVLARVTAAEGLSVTARDTRTTSDGPARFVVLADARGRVSVAALEGKTRFAASGKTVTLPAGTSSSSAAGGPPEDPERIAEDVLLNVVWPAGERHGETAEIQGRAAASSTVSVNGTPAPVGTDGHFSTTIPLHDGKNVVDVEAEDLAGRTRHDATTLTRRSGHPPKLTPEATDLWKK